jgi:hypothetical protein
MIYIYNKYIYNINIIYNIIIYIYTYCSLVLLTLQSLVPRGRGGLAALATEHATTGLGHHDGGLQGLSWHKVESC